MLVAAMVKEVGSLSLDTWRRCGFDEELNVNVDVDVNVNDDHTKTTT